MDNKYLEHHGVKGMKWGVRRYQNKNGNLTSVGKKRYGAENQENQRSSISYRKKGLSDNQKTAIKIGAAAVGAALAAYGTYKLAKTGKLNTAINKGKTIVEKIIKSDMSDRLAKTSMKKDVKNRRLLSDEILKQKIERIKLQRELKDLTKEELSPGRKVVEEILSSSGKKVGTALVTGATLYGVKSALKRKFNVNEFADYMTPKPKK